jgi:hypothetical protein
MTHSDRSSNIECRTLMVALVEKKRGLVRSEKLGKRFRRVLSAGSRRQLIDRQAFCASNRFAWSAVW